MRQYGLIGFPLGHSFSQKYFTEKFIAEGLADCSYENFEMKNIDNIRSIFNSKNFVRGLNVTLPHKNEIVDFLDEQNEIVQQINSCNCIKIDNGKWIGYNTDVIGFEKSFTKNLLAHHTKALILGTGGSSKAVEFVLKKLNIDYLFVSTSKLGEGIINYNLINEDTLNKYTIVINTTPVGTHPNTNECPQLPYDLVNDKHYFFDLVYNPEKTLFLKKAEERNATIQNGYDMLVTQAEESWKIWNG